MSVASDHFNTLARIEKAVESGHFNLAKVLRALAHVQRHLALIEARTSTTEDQPSDALRNFLKTGESQRSANGTSGTAHSNMMEIARRSLESFETNEDVAESDVAQWLYGCSGCGNVVEGEKPDVCGLCGALAPEFVSFGPFFSGTVAGSMTPREIVSVLESVADEVARIVSSVSDETLSRKPAEGEWSAKETLAHMLETDALFADRIKYLLAGDSSKGWPSPMAPWLLHEGKGYNDIPIGEVLSKYEETRRHSLDLLNSLNAEDWAIQIGSNSLLALGTWASTHDRGHMEQLRRACKRP